MQTRDELVISVSDFSQGLLDFLKIVTRPAAWAFEDLDLQSEAFGRNGLRLTLGLIIDEGKAVFQHLNKMVKWEQQSKFTVLRCFRLPLWCPNLTAASTAW